MGDRDRPVPDIHVALFPWGGVIEDFLGPIGVDRRAFAEEMTGGWLFGYVDALCGQDMRTTIFCFSRDVEVTERRVNAKTGVVTLFLPPSRAYLALRCWPGDSDHPGRPRLRRRLAVLQDLVRYFATPASVAREIRAEGCNVILTQEYENPRFDVLTRFGRRLDVPVLATFQGAPPPVGAIERTLRRRAIRRAAGFIVASAPEAQRLDRTYGLPAGRVARIPNPLDLSLWRPEPKAGCRRALGLPDDATVFVCHGRIDIHRKGLDVLLEAWRWLVARRPESDLRLHLIGSGQDDARLDAIIAGDPVKGLRWVRRYVNDRNELRRELSAADIYVLASRHEGFPVAPLEAMACGLAVVAADAPGIPDIFAGGERDGGLVVARGDSRALGSAMERLACDRARRSQLAASAQKRVTELCSLSAVGRQLANFICIAAGRHQEQ